MNLSHVGEGKVVLISGGGKVYTDIAARFCNSNKELEDILGSEYNKNIVKNIIGSGHLAATEFDNFIFGIEGFSRVTEAQLIRKRLASYLIKSGRQDKDGKREYDVVLPKEIMDNSVVTEIPSGHIMINGILGTEYFKNEKKEPTIKVVYDTMDILNILESWYDTGVNCGYNEESLRYLKPQGTEIKAIFSMNAHALIDWFKIRMCENAQTEIRGLAYKMYKLCMGAAPDLFREAGPSCKVLGYCPEGSRQNEKCKNRVYTKEEAMQLLSVVYKKSTL